MGDPKLLTESGWKALAAKFKIKDNGLQKALAAYEKLGEDEHDDCLKGLAAISQLAATLKKGKEVTAAPAAAKYLSDVMSAADGEKAEVTKAKAGAAKDAAAAKKAEADEAKKSAGGDESEEEEEEEEGDFKVKFLATYQKLKNGKDLEYQFIVCDAKPRPMVIMAKRITPKHKEELTKLTGGSKKFLKVGTCTVEAGKINFTMEQPPAGLARKLQESIKYVTGKKLPVMVGKESAEDVEEEGEEKGGAGEDAGAAGAETGAGAGGEKAEGAGAEGEDAAKSTEGKTGPFKISASVGQGGKNKLDDVKAVQAALNLKTKADLTVDGKCGPKTIGAIKAFQKTLGSFTPDGLVDVGRGTARALAGAAKPGPAPAPPKPVPPPTHGKPALDKAPTVWKSTRDIVEKNINELKNAVHAEYALEHPDLVGEIKGSLKKLDGILEKLDHKLTESLTKAGAAANDAARKAELQNSKVILANYIKYVKSEPLIAHIDSNPFGVDTKLKKILTDSLTHMAQSIG